MNKILTSAASLAMAFTLQWAQASQVQGVSVDQPNASPTGAEVAFSADYSGHPNIWIATVDGKTVRQLTTGADLDADPVWSPDGKTIVYASRTNEIFDLWAINANGTNARQLTANAGNNMQPTWSPDGTKIAFTSNRSGSSDVWLMNADGTGPKRLTTLPGQENHPSFSPLGDEIVFSETTASQANLMVVKIDGTGLRSLTTGPVRDWNPSWSRYGIVFSSNRDSGASHLIWTVKPDGSDLKANAGRIAGIDPAWMPDGQILYSREDAFAGALSAVTLLNPSTGTRRFVTNVAGYLTPIDIRPGTTVNRIHPGGRGAVRVAILSTKNFDAFALVNQATLTFGHSGSEASLASCGKKGRDVNSDGLRDLVCRFRLSATGFQPGDTVGILRFKTIDEFGGPYEGRDSIKIVNDDDDEDLQDRADD